MGNLKLYSTTRDRKCVNLSLSRSHTERARERERETVKNVYRLPISAIHTHTLHPSLISTHIHTFAHCKWQATCVQQHWAVEHMMTYTVIDPIDRANPLIPQHPKRPWPSSTYKHKTVPVCLLLQTLHYCNTDIHCYSSFLKWQIRGMKNKGQIRMPCVCIETRRNSRCMSARMWLRHSSSSRRCTSNLCNYVDDNTSPSKRKVWLSYHLLNEL